MVKALWAILKINMVQKYLNSENLIFFLPKLLFSKLLNQKSQHFIVLRFQNHPANIFWASFEFKMTHCSRGQVYNVQFQRTYLEPDSVPSSICAKATVLNGPDQQLLLPNACVQVDKSHMWFEGNTIERSWYLHGNATRECSLVENTCRGKPPIFLLPIYFFIPICIVVHW